MSELFDEVDEEVRREQLKKLWDKYSLYFIALMVLVVAAVGGWRGYQYLEAKKAAEAGATFEKAVELSEQGKHAEAETAFADLAAKAPSGYRTLARLRAAAEASARDPKAAAKMYDDIAADSGVGSEWRDLAKIRAAGLLVDSASYADIQQRLETSAEPKSTFRHSAREIAGAVGLAQQRHDRGPQMGRRDRRGRRNAAGPALARRSAPGLAAARRQELIKS